MWFSKKSTQPVTLPADAAETALAAFFGGGAKFALCYANMNGYLAGTVMEDHAAFMVAIQAEPAFTDIGRAYALTRIEEDLDLLCRLPQVDPAILFLDLGRQPALRAHFDAFRAAVATQGSQAVLGRVGLDPLAWLGELSVQLRGLDVQRIRAVLDEKKLFLKPLLMRARATGRNAYGDYDLATYFDELSKFFDYAFPQGTLKFFQSYRPLLLCHEYVWPWLNDSVDFQVMPLDGIDFEHWCAAKLEEQAWRVRISQASGDQGIDIEAMRPGFTVAIQCKRYADPIGNKAVQEAYAGKVHYQANSACVIGTGGFTRSARELARSTGVLLLDADNINAFSELIVPDA